VVAFSYAVSTSATASFAVALTIAETLPYAVVREDLSAGRPHLIIGRLKSKCSTAAQHC
jgi:hypothetical protein